jgi:hypothetical protein
MIVRELRYVGFYREFAAAGGPLSIRDHIFADRDSNADRILGYLEEGTCLLQADDLVRDVLDPKSPIIGSTSLLTDATWVWPSYLPYFVRTYQLGLPSEFLTHMAALDWKCPEVDPAYLSRLVATLTGNVDK